MNNTVFSLVLVSLYVWEKLILVISLEIGEKSSFLFISFRKQNSFSTPVSICDNRTDGQDLQSYRSYYTNAIVTRSE